MKLISVILTLVTLNCSTFASSVTVNGEKFLLASSGNNQAEVVQEFLPEGEKLESWTRLVSVREVAGQNAPKDYVDALAETYHTSYPHMQFAVGGKKDEWFIDFIAYPRELITPTYVEWNFFIARRNKKGVVVCQYAVRHYSNKSLDDAFQHFDVSELRARLLEKLKMEKFEIK